MIIAELFVEATNAYKDWWMCGRDFNLHADKFEAWDIAINTYAFAAGISRGTAVDQVRAVLGMSNQL